MCAGSANEQSHAQVRGPELAVAEEYSAQVSERQAIHRCIWPHYNRYNALSDRRHDALAAALAGTRIPFLDLKRDLAGVRDAFRKTDMHWTESGCEIVAARLASAALALPMESGSAKP